MVQKALSNQRFFQFVAMYTVYALKSIAQDWIYVGMTNNLPRRLAQHQAKQNTSTQYYAPFLRFYEEVYETSSKININSTLK